MVFASSGSANVLAKESAPGLLCNRVGLTRYVIEERQNSLENSSFSEAHRGSGQPDPGQDRRRRVPAGNTLEAGSAGPAIRRKPYSNQGGTLAAGGQGDRQSGPAPQRGGPRAF